jgi:hypothetical protein
MPVGKIFGQNKFLAVSYAQGLPIQRSSKVRLLTIDSMEEGPSVTNGGPSFSLDEAFTQALFFYQGFPVATAHAGDILH